MEIVRTSDPSYSIKLYIRRNLWWIAPIVIIIPLVYISGNVISPIAAYYGTSSAWKIIEKIFDLLS